MFPDLTKEDVASIFLIYDVGEKEKQYQSETTTYLNLKPQNHHKQDGVILIWEEW